MTHNHAPAVDFPDLRWRPVSEEDLDSWAALIARTAALINGTPIDDAGRQGPQAAIDAMFAQ